MGVDVTEAGLVEALGFRLDEVGPDVVTLSWDVRAQHLQPYGIVHGGVHCAAIETTASVGAALWYGDRGKVVGVHNATDFLRAVRSGRLTARAVPVHRGRLQQLWAVEVTGEDGRLVAKGQVRLQNLPAEPA